MRIFAFIILTISALRFSCASVFRSPLSPVVHEKRDVLPPGWTRSRKLDSNVILPMRFGLKQNNLDRVEEYLMDISHPESPNYSRHWTPDQVASAFAPSKQSIDAVQEWLHSAGFSAERVRLTSGKGWLELNATTAEVEKLLDTEYHVYSHELGAEHAACDAYSVPMHIREHIDLIIPTVNFDAKFRHSSTVQRNKRGTYQTRAPKSKVRPVSDVRKPGITITRNATLTDCDTMITPDCLRVLYNFTYTPKATKNNSFGVVEFTPQGYTQSDLNMFFTNFTPSLVGTSPSLVSIDGGSPNTFSFDLAESDLDLEYAMSLAEPQPVTLYQVGDTIEQGFFGNFLDAVDGSYCTSGGGDDHSIDGTYPDPATGGYKGQSCGIAKPANVISTSYGSQEADLMPSYMIRQCNEYAKLGMMGVTILYSSGDNGVAGSFFGACIDADGQEDSFGKRFNPAFPATCPYVTAVGATQINPGSTVQDAESACQQVIFSGGGFSNVFQMSDYQSKAVTNYLTAHPPPYTATQYNNTGKARGFPDLSANGANYITAVEGKFQLLYGTSASAPVVGALITAINDARISAGKNPVGFINPTIYTEQFAAGFNDITTGNNPGCGTQGFPAVPGWDPVTGVGTPNFGKLLQLWSALP